MNSERSETSWRQGHLLSQESARRLNLTNGEKDECVAVVISHDCDIVCSEEKEPFVELIVGRQIERAGSDAHAKNVRRLDLPLSKVVGLENAGVIALAINDRIQVPKSQFLASDIHSDLRLGPEAVVTLQHWLAARYYRASFEDEFVRRLQDKPGKVDQKLARILEKAGEHIIAIYFDVDGGEQIPRVGPEDVYELRISLLYDSTRDEEQAFSFAKKACDELVDLFEKYYVKDSHWSQIRLASCEAISDNAMTVAQSRHLKAWRLDHLSLQETPQQITSARS